MHITLHWHDTSTGFKNITDGSLAYKKRLGHLSNSLDTRIAINVPSKIDVRWKKNLTSKLEGSAKFKANCPCKVYVGNFSFEMHGTRTAFDFVGRLANLILRSRHKNVVRYGIKPEQIK